MVLFASYSGALGGAERVLVGWALSLDEERCLACPEGPLAEAARAAGIRTFPLRERSLELRGSVRDRLLAPLRIAAHRRELRALASDLDPEVIVLCGMRSVIAGALGPRQRNGGALVFQQSDLLPGPAIGRVVRRAAGRCDLVLAPSHAVAGDLDPGGGLGPRLEVVHPGVDPGRFASAQAPGEPPQVLVLGAIVDSKRPDLALEAFALARAERPDLRLRMVGEPLTPGDQRLAATLRARASRPDLAGSVEFLGVVEDPLAELVRATCLLHCAPREAFGMAVLETLATGRPAVVPSAGGPAEIVDESCGTLYPPGDARAAAAGLLRIASDPELAARMGAAGRERARERFDAGRARRRWAAAVDRVRPRDETPALAADRLAIVTVTHNSAAVLAGLLDSVRRELPGAAVVVVDSASSDETLEVATGHGAARVVALEANVGFGSACNIGLREVSAPVVALLNPDVELVDRSLLAAATEVLDPGRPDRLLAPLVLNPDGTRQDTVHPEPGSAAELMQALVSPSVVPRALARTLAPWLSDAPRRVGWAVGAALVARAATLRRLGPLDEDVFMYGEDLDLGLRAGQQGIETWFWPAARVIHHRAHSSRVAFGGEPFERLARARRDVVARRLGPGRAELDDRAQALTFASRIAVKAALGRSTARERRQLEALRSARRDA